MYERPLHLSSGRNLLLVAVRREAQSYLHRDLSFQQLVAVVKIDQPEPTSQYTMITVFIYSNKSLIKNYPDM
jgi:hypothetical protein